MAIKRWRGLVLALLVAVAPSARAADKTTVVNKATRLLEEISSNPDSGIPPEALREAKGILIMPHIVETHLGLGRKKGHGLFLSRDEKGEWGHPKAVEVARLSVGAEAGREITDTVIIFRTRKAIESYEGNRLELGLWMRRISKALKKKTPGRFWGPGPDDKSYRKETLSYVRRRGLILGATLGEEVRRGPSSASSDEKEKPRTAAKPPESRGKERVEEARPATPAKRPPDSPEITRLKAVLTAMTTPPPAVAAKKATRDDKVSTASGERRPAGPAPSVR